MGQLDPKALGHNSAAYLHTFTEVSKQASQTARDYAADPEVKQTPLDQLLSKEYWAQEAAKVDSSQASSYVPPQTFGTPTGCGPNNYSTPTSTPNAQGHTTHFVVADKEGNVVSATQTLGDVFGSKVMPQGTGIWLNNALAWSRFEPAGNVFDVFPGRQSLYALCPTIVMSDGRPTSP